MTQLAGVSRRTGFVLVAGAILWYASAAGLLEAGREDNATLLLGPIFAISMAASASFLRIESGRWPIEAVFVGAVAGLLGPVWALGVVLSARLGAWCVRGKPRLDSVLAAELPAVSCAAIFAWNLADWAVHVAFLGSWLAIRRTPWQPALALGACGVAVAGLSASVSPMGVIAGLGLSCLLLSIALAERTILAEQQAVLHALTMMLQRAHPYTHAHIERVARIAERTALHLGLSSRRAKLVHQAARLHDVGKIAVDEEILDKPDRLTSEEYAHVKLHAAYGAAILEKVDRLRSIADWIRCHHERPDGSGYPRGLKGNQIPIEARIIAAADAFDAMTGGYLEGERRPYRDPISPQEAMAELERCAGTQFDSRVVAAFRQAVYEEAKFR